MYRPVKGEEAWNGTHYYKTTTSDDENAVEGLGRTAEEA